MTSSSMRHTPGARGMCACGVSPHLGTARRPRTPSAPGHGGHGVLQVRGPDVVAGGDDQVLLEVGEDEVAPLVDMPHFTGQDAGVGPSPCSSPLGVRPLSQHPAAASYRIYGRGRAARGDRPGQRPAAARQGHGVRVRDRGPHRRELVWESTSTHVGRGRGDEPAPSPRVVFRRARDRDHVGLPGDPGRRYAAVSRDHNPIHVHPLSAKAPGFPRQIAHGVWSLARCVAALSAGCRTPCGSTRPSRSRSCCRARWPSGRARSSRRAARATRSR